MDYINKVEVDGDSYIISNLTDGTHTVRLPELADDDEFVLRNSCDADLTRLEQGKADKKSPSAANNVALLDSGGNLVDSGKQLTPAGIGAEKLISRGAYFGDLNYVGNTDGTLYDNSVVWFGTPNGTTNAPDDGYGFCLTWSNGGDYVQELQYTDGTVYRRSYYDGGTGNTWHDWQMVLTDEHGKAVNAAKADGITDYTDSTNTKVIKVGWQGASVSASDLKYVAAYTAEGNIKDIKLADLKTALNIKGGFVERDSVNGMTNNYEYICNPTSSIVGGYLNYGTWTPKVDGAVDYAYHTGTFIIIGNMCVLQFYIYGKFGGSTTSRFKITGAPMYPVKSGAGGGSLSGYTSPSNVVFTGYEINAAGNIYALGQETTTSSSNRWQSTAIYQKASGDFSASGTISFQIS